jgi:hypothetical protein
MDQAVAAYLCILLVSVAILYDQLTKRIPTRLRADQVPKSGYGLITAPIHDAPVRAVGIE